MLCREWNWVQANGSLRDMIARGFMLEFHRKGHITLPPKKRTTNNPFVNRKKPGQAIYFNGQVPINANIYELEKLRCNLCGMVFTAQVSGNKTGRDYYASAMAMIPLLKYGCGFPWSRLAKLLR